MTSSSDSPRICRVDASHICELIRIGDETNLSPWTAQSYLDEMKNRDSVMLRLAGIDNTTIGFVVGRFVAGGQLEPIRDAEIYNIAVVEHEQRKGFGQLLFDRFLSVCRNRQAANIWLEVRQSNTKAIGFYEKNGFEPVQTRNHFYDNPREHAVLMRLSLTK